MYDVHVNYPSMGLIDWSEDLPVTVLVGLEYSPSQCMVYFVCK